MTSHLRNRPEPRRAGRWPNSPYIDWGDSKRLLASMRTWVYATHGEHVFAPCHPTGPQPTTACGNTIREVHSRWPLINGDHSKGHYSQLRKRIETYAVQLAAELSTPPTACRSAN